MISEIALNLRLRKSESKRGKWSMKKIGKESGNFLTEFHINVQYPLPYYTAIVFLTICFPYTAHQIYRNISIYFHINLKMIDILW